MSTVLGHPLESIDGTDWQCWTVYAEISRRIAFKGITELVIRTLGVAAALGLLLLVAFALLARLLARSARTEEVGLPLLAALQRLLDSYRREQDTVTALQELDRTKTEFVASVSHELRTPLTSISGYTQRLLDPTVGEVNAEQCRMLHVVERNSMRLLRGRASGSPSSRPSWTSTAGRSSSNQSRRWARPCA